MVFVLTSNASCVNLPSDLSLNQFFFIFSAHNVFRSIFDKSFVSIIALLSSHYLVMQARTARAIQN